MTSVQEPLVGVSDNKDADADAIDAERARSVERLRALLPELRTLDGFPQGSDDDILSLSDPPHYTACPNPFLGDFIARHGKPYDEATDTYHREPFAVDVSEGKTDPLYKAHSYHTKVPHLAIVPSILHYTEPGDVVLDGFCGSGMTGLAAQWCGCAPTSYRSLLEMRWEASGRERPRWGSRRAVLNDLSPAATSIAANYNLPLDVTAFVTAARRILAETADELGWMYETLHSDGRTGRIEYTVWSEIFACPGCGGEITFIDEALDQETKHVKAEFPCPRCALLVNKDRLQRLFETRLDPARAAPWQRIKLRPTLISYRVGGGRHEKKPDDDDLERLNRIESLQLPPEVPTEAFPIAAMYHGSRLAPKGFTHVHHMYLPRAAQVLGTLWCKARAHSDQRIRHMLLFWLDSHLVNLSIENRYRPEVSFPYNPLSGVYYVPSLISEASPFTAYQNKLTRILEGFSKLATRAGVAIATGDCAELGIPANSIDYIFTDPPFGENIYYADLNFLVEAWHRVFTNAAPEAIIDQAKHKKLADYQRLMQRCFAEYFRVLKPGRWMTVVFHNSRSSVWNAIQEAILAAGFMVADVRTMDKQQGSYRQVTSTAVKQDLVISAYRPRQSFAIRFEREAGTPEGAWDFVRQHLAQLPTFVGENGKVSVNAERQQYLLFDRMVAFHIQHGATVPLSASEFSAGLQQSCSERDGMYFLPEQVAEYDQKRAQTPDVEQFALFVDGEKTAVQWLRQLLESQPLTYQEIYPRFQPQLHQAAHEQVPELMDMLSQNFLKDEKDRWYVPDPNKQSDLEKLRERGLLREFEVYAAGRGKLKVFRSEAVRAGFSAAWRNRDYATIVRVAQRLPEAVLQEDAQLLMYYDNASTRVEG